jgi:predicted oxidoreductase
MQEDQNFKTADDLVNEALGATSSVDDEVAKSDQLAQTLSSLQGVIERNAMQLQTVEEQLKEKRQMLKNIFDNDAQLSTAQEEAKQVTQKQKERKAQLQNDGQAVSLKLQIAEVNQQKK